MITNENEAIILNKKPTPRNAELHHGHRDRMKNKLITNKDFQFADHELIEMMLYYSIPRKDTNELAHMLLNTFGNIKNIVNADYYALTSIKGISSHTASLILLISRLLKTVNFDKERIHRKLSTIKQLIDFVDCYFLDEAKEIMLVIYTDINDNFIDIDKFTLGKAHTTEIPTDKVLQKAMLRNATNVLLVHNHPKTNCYPSDADIVSSINLKSLLNGLKKDLIEHLIIGEDEYCSIMDIIQLNMKNYIGIVNGNASNILKNCEIQTFKRPKY